MIESIPGPVWGVAAVAVLYTIAKIADALRRGNRRNSGGEYAPDRTTQVERALKFAGIATTLITVFFVYTSL